MDVCVLDDVISVAGSVRSGVGGGIELRVDKGHRSVLQIELIASRERVIDPVHAEGLKQGARQLYVGASRN